MGLISRVSSRTYRFFREVEMLRVSRVFVRGRGSYTIRKFEASEGENTKFYEEVRKYGKTSPLNPVDLTSYKIEKRTTWPRKYPLTIFNPDGSSYQISYHEPKSVIQIPKDVSQEADPDTFVRNTFIKRTGSVGRDYAKLERNIELDEFDDDEYSKERKVS